MSIITDTGREFHKGCVAAIFVERDVRIMSDVWATQTFAAIWMPEGVELPEESYRLWELQTTSGVEVAERLWNQQHGTFFVILLNCSEFGPEKHIAKYEVDGSPECLAAWEGWQKGLNWARRSRQYDSTESERQRRKAIPEKGKLVRVTSGRKVKQGTEGRVFWVGDNQWGTVLGLGLPDENGNFPMVTKTGPRGKVYQSYKDVVFVAFANVSVIDKLGGPVRKRTEW